MRQVPLKILIIGSGRLAKHWLHYHNEVQADINISTKFKISQWDRTQDPHQLSQKIQASDLVYLCIADSTLTSFYSQFCEGFDHCLFVHFSGNYYHEKIIGAHPLMTFTSEVYPLDKYQMIHFVLDHQIVFSKILPAFNNTHSFISSELKSMYHSQCVMSGNFPHLLWKSSWLQLKSMNVPFQSYIKYLQANLDNFALNPEDSLTGPLVRNDECTIAKHLTVLNSDEKNLYKSFLDFYKNKK